MVNFQFLGFAAFLITTETGKKILIDPYIDKNPVSPLKTKNFSNQGDLDLLLISHAAFDHLGDAAEIALKTGCPVICGGDSKALLLERGVPAKQIQETVWGLTVEAGGIRVRPVESRHRSGCTLQNGMFVSAIPLGFIIFLEDGTKVYNASDTAIFSDMKLIGEFYKPDVGLINVTIENDFDFLPTYLTGEMTAEEAALASRWLDLDYAVACHYTRKNCPDIELFIKLLTEAREKGHSRVKPVALEPGEIFTFNKRS